jgi:hypothetical protein
MIVSVCSVVMYALSHLSADVPSTYVPVTAGVRAPVTVLVSVRAAMERFVTNPLYQ